MSKIGGNKYMTSDGDSVDRIAWLVYGSADSRYVYALLEANPGLAARGPVLDGGLIVDLPSETTITPKTTEARKLWT
jgi:phage tail protein X